MKKKQSEAEASQKKITRERLKELSEILARYRDGKRQLEKRIIQAEEFWKLRHWQSIRPHREGEIEPASGWLVNAILSKHSDAVDAYPEPIVLPREETDRAEAGMLSSVLPVVLRQNDFEQTWSDVWWYKLKSGTGVYGVFWDPERLGGLGDIAIEKVDILNLFWEPGVQDIQDSQYLFCVRLQNTDRLRQRWPELQKPVPDQTLSHYRYDDAIPTADKTAVVDVYYKKDGLLHYIKYAGETVLFATEDDPALCDRGLYDHGKYPFIFDPLFPEEGYPHCGYGYVDLCRDPQRTIDILNNAFVKNTLIAATPRWFIRSDGGVDEAEYADFTKPFVHVQGRVDTDSVQRIDQPHLDGASLSMVQMKINEIKEVSGNRDVNNGSSRGVTAASAIAALQEAGNGLSRDMTHSGYRAFRKVVELCIELIRQFYELPRTFRILGTGGAEEFVRYSNQGLQPQSMGRIGELEMGMRLPVFDIDVEIQSQSAYTRQTANDLAVRLYQLGVFAPGNAEQSLMLLDMMDFKGKENLVRQLRVQASRERMAVLPQSAAQPQSLTDSRSYLDKVRQQAVDGAKP